MGPEFFYYCCRQYSCSIFRISCYISLTISSPPLETRLCLLYTVFGSRTLCFLNLHFPICIVPSIIFSSKSSFQRSNIARILSQQSESSIFSNDIPLIIHLQDRHDSVISRECSSRVSQKITTYIASFTVSLNMTQATFVNAKLTKIWAF